MNENGHKSTANLRNLGAPIELQPKFGLGGLSCFGPEGLEAAFGALCKMGLCWIQASVVLLERADSREREVVV